VNSCLRISFEHQSKTTSDSFNRTTTPSFPIVFHHHHHLPAHAHLWGLQHPIQLGILAQYTIFDDPKREHYRLCRDYISTRYNEPSMGDVLEVVEWYRWTWDACGDCEGELVRVVSATHGNWPWFHRTGHRAKADVVFTDMQ
jgi:hypothetical protein